MGFTPISLDNYVALHLKNNPSEKEADVRQHLERALSDYQNRIKCSCGNDIWVIGSASVGNACFSCITGESHPTEDYEIDSAITKREKGAIHIDDMDPTKIAGLFTDDGYLVNSGLIKKPGLCLLCKNDDKQEEEMLCNMTRYDQQDEPEFTCFAFEKK